MSKEVSLLVNNIWDCLSCRKIFPESFWNIKTIRIGCWLSDVQPQPLKTYFPVLFAYGFKVFRHFVLEFRSLVPLGAEASSPSSLLLAKCQADHEVRFREAHVRLFTPVHLESSLPIPETDRWYLLNKVSHNMWFTIFYCYPRFHFWDIFVNRFIH